MDKPLDFNSVSVEGAGEAIGAGANGVEVDLSTPHISGHGHYDERKAMLIHEPIEKLTEILKKFEEREGIRKPFLKNYTLYQMEQNGEEISYTEIPFFMHENVSPQNHSKRADADEWESTPSSIDGDLDEVIERVKITQDFYSKTTAQADQRASDAQERLRWPDSAKPEDIAGSGSHIGGGTALIKRARKAAAPEEVSSAEQEAPKRDILDLGRGLVR